nr:FecR domain-containing protein [Thauera linaloolentis]
MDWFVRRRDAGWQSDQEPAFQAWLAADPRHTEAYQRCSRQWNELDGMPADLLANMRRNLVRDKARPAAGQAPAVPSRRRFLLWPAYSAMAAVVGGVGYVTWQHLQAQPIYTQAFQTARGQQQNVQLSDGTRLRLDTATRLEVSYYRQRREVRIIGGQAVFEVQAAVGSPFHVLAGPMRVTVAGTRFLVRYTPDLPGNASVQVAVEEGAVRVARLVPAEAEQGRYDLLAGTLLLAGQQIAADEQGELGPIAAVVADGIAPWREQRVSFVDVPLGQALAELERYRSTGLVVPDPAVAALRLSGTFDPMNPAALRAALPRVLPVRLHDRGGHFEVAPIRMK